MTSQASSRRDIAGCLPCRYSAFGHLGAEAQLQGLGVSGCPRRPRERGDRLQQRGGQMRAVPLEASFTYSLGQQIDNGTLDLIHLIETVRHLLIAVFVRLLLLALGTSARRCDAPKRLPT